MPSATAERPVATPMGSRATGVRRFSVAAVLLLTLAGCRRAADGAGAGGAPPTKAAVRPAATFVGRAACEKCHAEEARRWHGSHHDLAMQEASEKTVVGNFENASFTHFGVTSTFFKRDGKFYVRTDGPDGKLREYPIAYTFGTFPLQQYLIAFPGGRYQALNVCWDTRPAKQGGQRWFHLYPKEEVPHGDPLHWTGPYQNWNFMCAECHSTNVAKGYHPEENRYETTFSEINVSCEACHGPGSAHSAWGEEVRAGRAKKDDPDKRLPFVLGEPEKASWIINPETGLAKRSVPRKSRTEIEMCGRCHARRSVVAADYVYGKPLADTHRPVLLEPGLYYADGQIEDEVYEYQSFLESRMFANGVTCSDCHNPHDMKVAGSGDRVCAACHAVEKFETPQAPLPQGRLDGRQLHRLPHADAQLHGRPRPARPQHPDSEAGPVGLHRNSQRLRGLPQESLERVGVAGGAQVVGREAAKRAALRGDDPGRPGGPARRRRGAREARRRRGRSRRSCGEPRFPSSAGRTERPRRTFSRRRSATRIPSCAAGPSSPRRLCLRRRGWPCFRRSSPIPC